MSLLGSNLSYDLGLRIFYSWNKPHNSKGSNVQEEMSRK